MGKFDIILGLGVVGIGGYVFIKHIWPSVQREIESLGDILGGGGPTEGLPMPRVYEDYPEPPEYYGPQRPIYEDRYPDYIIEDRYPDYYVPPPVIPSPIYPPVYQPPILPPIICPPGMKYDDGRCRQDCPDGWRFKDGVCKPRDCDNDEYFDGRRCKKIDCPSGFRWKDGRCQRRDNDRDDDNDRDRDRDRDRIRILPFPFPIDRDRDRPNTRDYKKPKVEKCPNGYYHDGDKCKKRSPETEHRWDNGNSRDKWHEDRDREQQGGSRDRDGRPPIVVPRPEPPKKKEETGTPETDRLKEIVEKAEKNFIELWLDE